MPIIVRELIIRARVEEAANTSHRNALERPPKGGSGIQESDVQRIVALCVEEVMINLDRNQER